MPHPTTLSATVPTAAVLLIFGTGGHGRVVADAALLQNCWLRIVASDRDPAQCQGNFLPGVALLDPDAAEQLQPSAHIGIGNNQAREREAACWGRDRLVTIIHPSATLSRFAFVGEGCFFAAGSIVGPGAKTSIGVIVNHGAVLDHDAEVDAFSHVAPHATLGGGVRIGRRVLIGAGAVVLPRMTISDDIIVGAGAVVRTSLTEPGIYAGVPARRIQ